MLARCVPPLVGGFSKAMLRALCNVEIHGRDEFLSHVARGNVLSISNHISLLDEPLSTAAYLPLADQCSERRLRYVLGAHDIMYKNAFLRWFFNAGQTVEVFRGGGIYQSGIDRTIRLLDDNKWVHMYPEGRLGFSSQGGALRRFKWGVARLWLEAKDPPVVVPIWLQGFERLLVGKELNADLPEGCEYDESQRNAADVIFGRLRKNVKLRITIGDPLDMDHLLPLRDMHYKKAIEDMPSPSSDPYSVYDESRDATHARLTVTAALQEHMSRFGAAIPPLIL